MSSRSGKHGKHSRSARERRRDSEKYNQDQTPSENVPRYDGNDPSVGPDDVLRGEMSKLEIDSSTGNGKGKGEWSEWTWSDERNCYYRARLNSSGAYEYEYREAYTTAPAAFGSRELSVPRTRSPGGYGARDPSISPTRPFSPSYSTEAQIESNTMYRTEIQSTSQTSTRPKEGPYDQQQEPSRRSSGYDTQRYPSASDPSPYYPPASSSYVSASSTSYPRASTNDSASFYPSASDSSACYPAASSSYASTDTSHRPSTYPALDYSSSQQYADGSTETYTDYAPGVYTASTEPEYSSQKTAPSSLGFANQGGYAQPYNMEYGPSSQHSQCPLPPIYLPPSNNIPCGCDPDSQKNLCGVLIWPKKPRPKDGEITDNPYSSWWRSPTTEKLVIMGPSGQACGPLYMPGITPGPRPPEPPKDATRNDRKAMQKDIEKWEKGWREWSKITCPCGYGYFNDDGAWIPGGEARAGKLNPRWAETGGRAILPEKPPDKKLTLNLQERYSYESDPDN